MPKKLPFLSSKHIVCLSAGYLLPDNGSGVVMRNLLELFDPSSYSLGVMEVKGMTSDSIHSKTHLAQTTSLLAARTKKGRLNNFIFDAEMPIARRRLRKLIRKTQASCIVVVYPTFHFLQLARDVAKELQIPWLAYWHDTVFETLSETPFAKRSLTLQQQTFDEASSVLVMSEGMVDFYHEHYGQYTTALEHSYPESIVDLPDLKSPVSIIREALWGGSIYGINNQAVSRVSEALDAVGMPFLITSRASSEHLKKQGIAGKHIRQKLFPTRKEYLDAVKERQILILALNWPDESVIEEGELSTIFPTKTIEYLASGRPILAHCPRHYFLARFIERHGCGIVVSERSIAALQSAIEILNAGGPNVERLCAKALQTAQLFAPERIGSLFSQHVQAVANAKWGEKIQS